MWGERELPEGFTSSAAPNHGFDLSDLNFSHLFRSKTESFWQSWKNARKMYRDWRHRDDDDDDDDDDKDMFTEIHRKHHLWAIGSSVSPFTHKETWDRWAAYLRPKLPPGIHVSGHIFIFWADLWPLAYFHSGGIIWNLTLAPITERLVRHGALFLWKTSWCLILECDYHEEQKLKSGCKLHVKWKWQSLIIKVIVKIVKKLTTVWIITPNPQSRVSFEMKTR